MKKDDKKIDLIKNDETWLYSDMIKDHFYNPRNAMSDEILEKYKASGVGEVGSPACGDVMRVWIKVDPKLNKIIDCKWRTFGCASAIAATSMLSVMVTEHGGMTLQEAKKITPQDIVARLGGLPKIKIHCSVLGDQALRAAIEDYEKNKK